MDPVFDAVRSRGSNVHAVPTSAGWFSWKAIHEIEKHTMPSFFNGKSETRTPEVYMDIRNFIMKKFHSDPQTPVEMKDVEGLSAGDLDARQEVLEFLAHWGLINFHPFPPGEDAVNNMVADDGVSRASSLLEKLYRFEEVRSYRSVVSQKIELPAPALQPASLNLAFAGDLGRPVEPSVEYHCNSCSADCSRKRYHCQKQADFDLCTECYNAGKFGSGMAASDFILMEPADAPGVSCGSWTDQETLLLLEALELFGENWSEIAEHVATKTKDQCMLHFIQMPIEDPFMDDMDEDKINIQEDKDLTLTKKDPESSNAPEIKETKGADDMDEHISLPIDDSKSEVPAEIDDSKKEVPAEIDDPEKEVPAEIDDLKKVPAEIDDSKKEVPAEINDSEIEVPAETDDSCKTGASIVLDILNAAFESIGFLPEQGGIKSFAEAGNSVMALAAFLVGLVEPETITTSVRSSLKAMSEDSPGIQLATRHCYLLEDPPIDMKDPPEPESMESGQPHKTEDQMLLSNGTDESKDCAEKNEQNDVQEAKQTEPSNSSQNPPDENKLAESVPPLEATDMNTEISRDQTLEEKQIMATDNDASVSVLPTMLPLGSVKESADFVLQGEDTTSTAMETNNLDMEVEEKPKFSKEMEEMSNAAGVMLISAPAEGQEEQQSVGSDAPVKREKTGDDDEIAPTKDNDKIAPPKDDDNKAPLKDDDNEKDCNSVEANIDNKAPLNDVAEKHCEPVEAKADNKAPTNNIDENNCNSAETNDDKNALPIDVDEKNGNPVDEKNGNPVKKVPLNEADMKSSDPVEANNDHGISKLKQAAVTAISAAAVKAKLLANQEEEQILELVSVVVENQLRKLEIKLALFNEMESVIARVREQIDRARQKLLQERQQIVASRLSLSAASLPASKPAASSKPPLGYGPALLRPPSMASLKPPPMKRP